MHSLPSSDAQVAKTMPNAQKPIFPTKSLCIKGHTRCCFFVLLFVVNHLVAARAVAETAAVALVGVVLGDLCDVDGNGVKLSSHFSIYQKLNREIIFNREHGGDIRRGA